MAWKLPLPAFSGSTPIIWNDTIFLNVATERATGQIELWAVDRNKQAVIWKRPLSGENRIGNKQNMSSPSPVTDGKHVWVMTGTGVLKAFDFAGKELWTRDIQKDYGKFGIQFGYASSPLLHGDALYLQVLHGMNTDDPSYVLKIDKMTGKTVWRVERPTHALHESPDSYTTPALLQHDGKTEIVITGGDVVTGHDPATGQGAVARRRAQPEQEPELPHHLVADHRRRPDHRADAGQPAGGAAPGGSGDVSSTHVAWTFHRGPDVPSPVSDGKYLYLVSEQGVVYCLELETGTLVYGPSRLPNDFYSSSPVLADGKIYVTGESTGVTTVFRAGPKFEILASNTFNDPCAPYCLARSRCRRGSCSSRPTPTCGWWGDGGERGAGVRGRGGGRGGAGVGGMAGGAHAHSTSTYALAVARRLLLHDAGRADRVERPGRQGGAARLRARSPSRHQGQRRDAARNAAPRASSSSASRRGSCSRTTWTTAAGSGASSSIADGCTSKPKSAGSTAIRSSSKGTTSASTTPTGGSPATSASSATSPNGGARSNSASASSRCWSRVRTAELAISEHRTARS